MPKLFTSFATSKVMSASSSAVGLKLTVVSARNKGPFFGEHDVHACNFLNTILCSYDLNRRSYGIWIVSAQSGYHGICIFGFYHHATKIIAVFHELSRFVFVDAPALSFIEKDFGIFLAFLDNIFTLGVDDFHSLNDDIVDLRNLLDDVRIAQQDGDGDALVQCNLCGFQHFCIFSIGKYNPLGIFSGLASQSPDQLVVYPQPLVQLNFISIPISNYFFATPLSMAALATAGEMVLISLGSNGFGMI